VKLLWPGEVIGICKIWWAMTNRNIIVVDNNVNQIFGVLPLDGMAKKDK